MAQEIREHWSSRLGFVMATAGSAIGLGILWKLPYVIGDSGGGIFVLIYFFFTIFLGIPLFIGELVLGRHAQRGAVGIFASLSGETSPWKIIGWLGVASSLLILSYYCVVAGWGLNYFMMSLNNFYAVQPVEKISSLFNVLYSSGDISLFWSFVFILLTFAVVYRGVRKGIEFWSRVLTIALLFLITALSIYAMTLPGFGQAVRFLFIPSLDSLRPATILAALGLSFFTLSLAQGVLLTYGSYLLPSEDLPKTALIVGGMVLVVAVLTSLLIFPVIFTFGLTPQGGAGLIFETLPVLFAQLPGSMLLSTIFFALFTFTGLTSAVALLEVVSANCIDLFKWSRHKAVILSTLAVLVIGIPSALAGSGDLFKDWFPIYGLNFFGTVDSLVSIWLLPIGGFLTAIYIGWHLDKELIRNEFLTGTTLSYLFSFWFFVIKWIAPIAIALIFLQTSGFIDIDKLLAN